MFIGHGLLAFALAVLVAEWRGWPTDRALAIGIATGAFAMLPDIDILFAAFELSPAELIQGLSFRPEAFWGATEQVHRTMTHSIVVAVPAGVAFGLWSMRMGRLRSDEAFSRRWLGHASSVTSIALLTALVLLASLVSGRVGVFLMASFAVGGLAIATATIRYLDLNPRLIGLAAVGGLASHPWGDLFTGTPPAFFYPAEVQFITDSIVLNSDPTLHLLGAFAIELVAISLAPIVVARQLGYRPLELLDRRAALGVIYGPTALVMVPPSVDVAYHFVFSITAMGVLCASLPNSPRGLLSPRRPLVRLLADPKRTLRTAITGLAGIGVAMISFACIYLVFQ